MGATKEEFENEVTEVKPVPIKALSEQLVDSLEDVKLFICECQDVLRTHKEHMDADVDGMKSAIEYVKTIKSTLQDFAGELEKNIKG